MSVERLRFLADSLGRGEVIAPDLARWFTDAVSRCEGQRGALERALNLPAGWQRLRALEERDRYIRRMRAEHFASMALCTAAKAIAKAGMRYQASAWQRFLTGGAPAPGDALGALIHAALATGAPWPRERRMRDILGNGRPATLP